MAPNPKATTATLALWPQEAIKLAAAEEFAEGGSVKLLPSAAAELGFPKDFDVNCKGSIRLLTRHSGQQGSTQITSPDRGGVCGQIFEWAWGQ